MAPSHRASPVIREFQPARGAPAEAANTAAQDDDAPAQPAETSRGAAPSPLNLRVITYNVLSNAMLNRSEYPTNGRIIYWDVRWPVLQTEIASYRPDILMLQEVDADKMPEWRRFLRKQGMECDYGKHPQKNHGVCIAWRSALPLLNVRTRTVKFDAYKDLPVQDSRAKQVGVVALFVMENELGPNWPPIDYIVASTHLAWRPTFAYERLRQFVLLLEAVRAEDDGLARVIIAGDFNTMPGSPLSHCFFENKADSEIDRAKLRTALLQSARSENSRVAKNAGSVEAGVTMLLERAQAMQQYVALRSVYLEAQGAEPEFTNWTDDFRETLDYILVSDPLQLRAVLATPTKAAMGAEPCSIPRIRGGVAWPSDHVALGVDLHDSFADVVRGVKGDSPEPHREVQRGLQSVPESEHSSEPDVASLHI